MPLTAPSFARVLGRADLVLFSVSAILTIDTLASDDPLPPGLTLAADFGADRVYAIDPAGPLPKR